MPYREINRKNYAIFLEILSHFRKFLLILSQFIGHFYNILGHQNAGPDNNNNNNNNNIFEYFIYSI